MFVEYQVIDFYEGGEVVADHLSFEYAQKIVRQRQEDTDGECDCEILPMGVDF